MMELVEAGGFPLYYKGQMVFVEAGRGVDGFKGVSPGKGGRFYGRIGGLKKGGHISVPGTYNTSAEAAAERALYKTKLESKELTAPGPKGPRLARGTGDACLQLPRADCLSPSACVPAQGRSPSQRRPRGLQPRSSTTSRTLQCSVTLPRPAWPLWPQRFPSFSRPQVASQCQLCMFVCRCHPTLSNITSSLWSWPILCACE